MNNEEEVKKFAITNAGKRCSSFYILGNNPCWRGIIVGYLYSKRGAYEHWYLAIERDGIEAKQKRYFVPNWDPIFTWPYKRDNVFYTVCNACERPGGYTIGGICLDE